MTRSPHRGRARGGRESGQAAVEFTLIAPLVFLVLFGIVQFGMLVSDYIGVTAAARAGARVAAVSKSRPNPVQAAIDAARSNAAELDPARMTVTVSPAAPWTTGQEVTVTVTYPFSFSVMGEGFGGDLQSSARVRVE